MIGFGTTEPPPSDGAGRSRGNACAFGTRDRSSRCVYAQKCLVSILCQSVARCVSGVHEPLARCFGARLAWVALSSWKAARKCMGIRNMYRRRRHSAGHGTCDECLYTTCHRHGPQASAARNRSSCSFPCAGIPAARGLNRMPTVRRLNSMYQEAFAVNQEEAGDEEYPDREPSPPASPLTRNISNFQRRWSIGLPRARSDSVSSIASM